MLRALALLLLASARAATLSYETPALTEEEERSLAVPAALRCDACCAVAHQLERGVNAAWRKYGRAPASWDLVDELDSVCIGRALTLYGVKSVGGENRLSGPGLAADAVPGVAAGGITWPRKLRDLCAVVVEREGEAALAAAVATGEPLAAAVCADVCSPAQLAATVAERGPDSSATSKTATHKRHARRPGGKKKIGKKKTKKKKAGDAEL